MFRSKVIGLVTIFLIATGGILFGGETVSSSIPSNKEYIYLSDYMPLKATCGYGKVGMNSAVIPPNQTKGGPLSLGGKRYKKGLGTHANSEIIYLLNGNYDFFRALIRPGRSPRASIIFQIYGDGKELFNSGVMIGEDKPKEIKVPIRGVQELKLVVTDAGDGNNGDTAYWVDAIVFKKGASLPLPSVIVESEKRYKFKLEPIAKVKVNSPIWRIASSDLDNDGKEEILLSCLNNYLYVHNQERKELWRYNIGGWAEYIATGDINGDGKKEIAIASFDGNIYLLNDSGKLLWKYAPGFVPFSVAIGETGDGRGKIAVGGLGRQIHLLDENGKLIWRFVCPEKIDGRKLEYLGYVTQTIGLAIEDLDNDGKAEVLISTGALTEWLFVLNMRGKVLWRKHVPSPAGKRGWLEVPEAGRNLLVVDLDQDGKKEIILGGRRTTTITLLDYRGERRWDFVEYGITYDTLRSIDVGDVTGDGNREILVNTWGEGFTYLLDGSGKEIEMAGSHHPDYFFLSCVLSDIDNDGKKEIIAGSSEYSDPHYYVLKPLPFTAPATGIEVNTYEKSELVRKTLSLREKVNSLPQKEVMERKRKITLLLEIGALKSIHARQLKATQQVLLSRYSNPNLKVAFCMRVAEDSPEYTKMWTLQEWAMPKEEIFRACSQLEENKVPFFLWCVAWNYYSISLDTAKKILERYAPKYCQGFGMVENGYKPYLERWPDIFHYTGELVKICHDYKKKFLVKENSFWWIAPTDKELFEKWFKYKDVIIPIHHCGAQQNSEMNIAGILGLYLSGIVDDWGYCPSLWNFSWGIVTGATVSYHRDVDLRMGVMMTSLGANYIFLENPTDLMAGDRVSKIGELSHDIVLNLIKKGLILPAEREDLLSIAPVAFQIAHHPEMEMSPPKRRMKTDMKGMFDYRYGLSPPAKEYVSSYLYGLNRYFEGLFPKNQYGFFATFPDYLNPQEVPQIKRVLRSDWKNLVIGDKTIASGEAKEFILKTFQKEAKRNLSFTAEDVFISAQKVEKGRYLVYLIDPGYINPVGADTLLKINLSGRFKVKDAITGEELKFSKKGVPLHIPAGTFRIIEVKRK